ncbi:hypothetical protein BD289DRAFT_116950 [Coniella lustricola]|uniref:Uncharacterized protein n=1 Tax=Coniella lustricola TaxID=2025994 RepID=A0A2T2ZWU8_9PEZI|nr:hypothetical protein BD289DRAFT_116950 [Coniella lustricola]
MSYDTSHLNVVGTGSRDDELFTTPSTDPTPDRHPSVLRPGGHASPLNVPAALRPGAGRPSRTPSPMGTPQPTASPYASPPAVTYKAYAPPSASGPAARQDSSEALSDEIEGYFTKLQVAPLAIRKTPSPEPALSGPAGSRPGASHSRTSSLEGRCVSPPVPPKERIPVEEGRPAVSLMSELDAAPAVHEQQTSYATSPPAIASSPLPPPPPPATEAYFDEPEHPDEPPPAYEEMQSMPPPPEKVPISYQPPPNEESPAGPSATVTAPEALPSPLAASGSGPTVDVPSDTVAGKASANEEDDIYGASDDEHKPQESASSAAAQQQPGTADVVPPPLPPRPTPSPVMPGAFPPPPPPRPAGASSSSSSPPPGKYKASGAAATSAAGVGGSVAGVGQSSSLHQARKALEKGIGHLIDKAKEHQAAREQQQQHKQQNARKSHHGTSASTAAAACAKGKRRASPDGAKGSATTEQGHVAQVSSDEHVLGLRWEAEQSFV